MAETLLSLHLVATAAMAGLIWFVQVVHYPLMAAVGEEGFVDYERAHMRRTGWVVGPLMGVEGVTALALPFVAADQVDLWLALLGLGILGGVHASTVFLQVPRHGRLADRHDADDITSLVRTNWVRTVGWTLRAVLAAVMLAV